MCYISVSCAILNSIEMNQPMQNSLGWRSGLRRRAYKFDVFTHIALCEANFVRLSKLLNPHEDRDLRECRLSFADDTKDVEFRIRRLGRYTTLLDICQESEVGIPTLRMKIHVYHDVKSAEVIGFHNQRRFKVVYDYPNPKMNLPNEKAQVNWFFAEFLEDCLKFGLATELEMHEAGDFLKR